MWEKGLLSGRSFALAERGSGQGTNMKFVCLFGEDSVEKFYVFLPVHSFDKFELASLSWGISQPRRVWLVQVFG